MQPLARVGLGGGQTTYAGGDERHTGQASTDGSGRTFRHVKGRQHGRSTNAKAGDEPANVHDGDVALIDGRGLHNDANESNKAGPDQSQSSSPSIAKPGSDEAGSETSGLEG